MKNSIQFNSLYSDCLAFLQWPEAVEGALLTVQLHLGHSRENLRHARPGKVILEVIQVTLDQVIYRFSGRGRSKSRVILRSDDKYS